MKNKLLHQSLSKVSDDTLLNRLSELLQSSRRTESELVAHIGEVDQRRLYARQASSMFAYCAEILHLSEHEAYLRIEVARASRKYPALLEMLADGRLHLSGIAVLHRHLTEENRDSLLQRATHRSKRQIEELVAELSPKPDVPSTIRKLPRQKEIARPKPSVQLGPDLVEPPPAPTQSRPAVVEPTSPARYKVSFTASAELRAKLERLRALMRSSVPDGDLATIIEEAVTEKLEKIESKRYGKTKVPRKSVDQTETRASSRKIPAPVKRAVHERDRGRCTFRYENSRRCTETRWLEFHHVRPYGQGGDHRPENIVLACRAHNLHFAEQDYGKALLERHTRRRPNRVSKPAARQFVGANRSSSSDQLRTTVKYVDRALSPSRNIKNLLQSEDTS